MPKVPGSFEIAQDNVIPVTMEDLNPEDHEEWLKIQAHMQNEYLKTFQKGRDDRAARKTQGFSMPAFKFNKDKFEVIDPVSTSQPQHPPIDNATVTTPTSTNDLVAQLFERI